MIAFDQVALRRGPKLLFSSASFSIHSGQHVGLTGRNGTGKSSLFSLLLGQVEPDAGEISMPENWVIAHVAQQTPDTSCSTLDYVLDGDTEFRQIATAMQQEQDGIRQAELHAHFEAIDGYRAEARAAQLLDGLGFRAEQLNQPVNSFSGGWRMRLNLAQALMCRSDLLLLDEPTNHLDLDAVIWLEEWLRQYKGTLLLISHDREFLDAVITHTLSIEHEQMVLTSGNYSAYELIRAERLTNQQSAYKRQQDEIKHIQQYVDRFRAKATKARQAQSRLKALERMELIAPAHVDSPFHFSFLSPEKQPNPLLKLDQASAAYDDTEILSAIEITIQNRDRIGLLGPNGAGKSTLIKLIAGMLAPRHGYRHQAPDCHIGYFAQHQLDQLDQDNSPFTHLRRIDPTVSDQQARDFLGGFGFNGDRVFEPVKPFSGGEKARLALALIVYTRPNLLLLDEPTNHLDIEMRSALVQALQDFQGAMLVVSHDRFLLRAVCDQLMLVHDKTVEPFDIDLDDYPAWLVSKHAEQTASPTETTGEHHAQARRDRKRLEAERRQQLAPLKKRLAAIEGELDTLQQDKNACEQQLADPGLYDESQKSQLRELITRNASLESAIASLEQDWLSLSEELDLLSSQATDH